MTIGKSFAIIVPVPSEHNIIWGYSSAGRALEWHSRGQRFDPDYLHQERPETFGFRSFSFPGKILFIIQKEKGAQWAPFSFFLLDHVFVLDGGFGPHRLHTIHDHHDQQYRHLQLLQATLSSDALRITFVYILILPKTLLYDIHHLRKISISIFTNRAKS